ncbi:CU044_2847 family protein [Actinomadura syzygii]|uniref:CU044_2847 family protein n=1 Tax=Actinomadura syzygii TaxID=1427538 RepID=UPI001651CDD4|nr:CU044_2847 family protein [Actinomadura syzygii]
MTALEIPLEGGGRLVVEVGASEREEIRPVGRASRVAEQAGATLQDALDGITPAVESIARKLRAVQDPPGRVEITFGIKVSGQADLMIAKTTSEAHFQVTAEWSGSA